MTTETLNEDGRDERFDTHWDQRLDDLITGDCSEEEFVAEVEMLRADPIGSPWAVVALMHQRFRRGQLPAETFRAIEARIARRELNLPAADATVDLDPAELPVISQRIREYSSEESDSTPRLEDEARITRRELNLPVVEPTIDLDPAELPIISDRVRNYAEEEPDLTPRVDDVVIVESVMPLQDAPPEGPMLRDRYEIKGAVAEGATVTVYQAIDHFRQDRGHAQSYVALKVLREGAPGYPEAFARLRREFYSAQSLAHRNIVKVFDIDRDGAVDFFTMEYLDGEPLSHVLKRFDRQPLPYAAAWSIVRQLAEALAHAHDRRVLHADLNPQNVMILHSGDVRILNFGASLTGQTGALVPAYASCELLAGEAADARDDLFALACIAYQLLTGSHPYGGQPASEARVLNLKPTRPTELSSRQWRVLEQGLSFDRANRSVTVRDWFKALGVEPTAWQGIPRPPLASAAPPPGSAVAAAKRSRRSVRLVSTVASIALIALLAVLYFRQAPVRRGAVAPAPVTRAPAADRADDAVPETSGVVPKSLPAAPPGVTAAPAPANTPRPPQPRAAAPAAAPKAAPAAPRVAAASPASESWGAPLSTKGAPEAPVAAKSAAAVAKGAPVPRPSRRAVKPQGGTYSLSARGYQVRPSARFVELKVVRSDATGAASVSWWTEDGSALAGIDYIAQRRTTAFFAAGSRSISLFIKKAGNEPRRDAANFSVQIANPSTGTVETARTRVTLLPTSR